ncbi:MAG: hypothetical protein GC160_18885 [Acidobacteria bacterium]|nr:hypothetical protein [Acidobacteriota bacterium]
MGWFANGWARLLSRRKAAPAKEAPREAAPIEIPPEKVIAVVEYTTPNGPWLDDYFLIVFTRQEFWEFPVDGRSEKFLERLRGSLGSRLEMRLTGHTDFRSRVVYPPAWGERPPMEARTRAATGGIGQAILRRLSPLEEFSFTSEFLEFVEASRSRLAERQTGDRPASSEERCGSDSR